MRFGPSEPERKMRGRKQPTSTCYLITQYPLKFLTVNDNGTLDDLRIDSSVFNCTISNTSIFNRRVIGSLLYEVVPGTTYTKEFIIPQRHEYIQFKFNAAIVQSTTVFLEY